MFAMPDKKIIQTSNNLYAACVGLAVFIILLAAKYTFIFGDVLYVDDGSYIGLSPLINIGLQWHMAVMIWLYKLTNSILAIKIFTLFCVSLATYFNALLLLELIPSRIKCFFVAVTPFLLPYFTVAMVASSTIHFCVGLSLALMATSIHFRALTKNSTFTKPKIIIVSVLYALAPLVVPVFYLIIAVPVVMAATDFRVASFKFKIVRPQGISNLCKVKNFLSIDCKRADFWSNIAVVTLVAILTAISFYFRGVYGHAKIPGWTNRDIHSVIDQFNRLKHIFIDAFEGVHLYVLGAFVIGLVILFISKRKASAVSFERLRYMLILLILSVITLIPPLAVIHSLDRYLLSVAFFFFSLLLFAFAIMQEKMPYYFAISALLMASLFINQKYVMERELGATVRNQQELTIMARHYYSEWAKKKSYQLVHLFNKYPRNGGGFYNHFTTGRMRYITKDQSLIAISGKRSDLSVDPFVENFRPHGKEYWRETTLKNGTKRLQRINFKGIEQERHTFAYQEKADGSFTPIENVCVNRADGIYHASYGSVFKKLDSSPCDPAKGDLVFNGITQ